MKRVIALACAGLMVAVASQAASLTEGTKELRWSGNVDFDSAAGTDIDFAIGYGMFLMDNVEVGGLVNFSDNDIETRWGFGGFAEYNLPTDTEYVPYVGGRVEFQDSDVEVGGVALTEDSALVFGVDAGLKWFLTESLAVDTAFVFDWATEDIYPEDNEVSDTDYGIRFGLRYFFQ